MKTKTPPGKIALFLGCAILTMLPMLNVAATCFPPPSGLVGWWQAEGDAQDNVGNNSGQLTNGTTFASGEVGQAFAFNGISALVRIPNAPALNPPTAMTLEAWIYISAFSVNDSVAVIDKDDPYVPNRQYMIGMGNSTGHWAFRAHLGTPGAYNYFNGTTALQAQTWYHVAMTYDGSTLKLFVNGQLDGSLPVTGPITVSQLPLLIGGHAEGPWNFNGRVDEVSLYNRALNIDEIQGIYTAGSSGKCTTPTAPIIYVQPTNQTVFASQSVTFVVGASGTRPLSYQWTFEGATIDGATSATLMLNNVALSQAGSYAVQITNSVGTVLSSNATLVVNPAPPCDPPPSGLISWWQAEGNPADETGLNNASLVNGVTYAPGFVGQAFAFDGNSSYVSISNSPSLNLTNEFTLELWYKDTGCLPGNFFYGLMGKRAPYPSGANFGISLYMGSPSYLQVYLQDPYYASYQITTSPLPQPGVFHHVAATYAQVTSEQVQVKTYVDGQIVGIALLSGNLARTLNNAAVTLGSPNGFECFFVGLIDEPSIYRRALSASEILAIYNAGVSGKCVTPVPVAIYAQPTNQTVTVSQTVDFSVGATGSNPLSYQWNFNGTSIPGATSAVLLLTNVQPAQAGTYSVLVSNVLGAVLSSNATLVVNPAPPCDPPPAGLISWWQAEGNALDGIAANNGTLISGAAFAPGMVGQAFSFTAPNQIVQVPNSPSLNPTTALTIEGWVLVTGNPSTDASVIVGKDDLNAGRQYELDVYKLGGQLVFLPAIGTPGSFVNMRGTKIVPLNVWTYVAMTYDGSALRLYVNGQLDTSMAFSGPVTTGNAPLTIGGIGTGPWSFFGEVDELSLYSRALSLTEIQAIYNAGLAGKCVTPVPVAIYSQPTNQVVTAGHTATFSVSATGSGPLSYQWNLNGTSIVGATSAVLQLANVQASQAGTYSVLVSNVVGAVLSSNATLVVNPAPACDPPPAGLISWWQAEGSPADETGLNNGTFVNGASYAPGLVGQAFAFNGINQFVRVPDSPSLSPTNALTLECWVLVRAYPTVDVVAIAAKEDPYGIHQYQLTLWNPAGQCYFRPMLNINGTWVYFGGKTVVQTGQWYHVATTYDGSTLSLYVNGALDGSVPASGAIVTSTEPLRIGGDETGPWFFTGLVDELALYGRALSAQEILAVFNAGVSGKCVTPVPVSIYAQPLDQSVTIGQTSTFTVGVSGSQPVSYQWNFNQTSIPGATASSLVLTNVQRGQAGLYSVTVSNSLGSVTSSNAALTVNLPPAIGQIPSISPNLDGSLSVPIQLVANGNETALGFSLNFPPGLLAFSDASLGSSDGSAALFINTNQAANGRLGVVISLPSNLTFAAGTQEVAVINFTTAVLSNAAQAVLSFGDQPTARQLSDPQANALPITFVGYTTTIAAAAFEGDVSPAPNGDKAVTVTDLVLIGRYAARLDYPTNASQYQRADCAPRSSLGDGAITVADWVQAGRYVVGLDPITRAGGPTNDVGPNVVGIQSGKIAVTETGRRSKGLSPRRVRVQSAYLAPGQPGTVSILLDAQGNENAVGFSLTFDPTIVSYTSANLGTGAAGATLDINDTQAGSGKLAFILALPTGGNFNAGTKELLQVDLKPAASASGSFTLALTDNLAIRQVVDPAAIALASDFINGSLVINSQPTLSITHDIQNVMLSWPLWATNFTLQEATSGSVSSLNWTNVSATIGVINNEAAVTLPVTGTTKLYRLQKH